MAIGGVFDTARRQVPRQGLFPGVGSGAQRPPAPAGAKGMGLPMQKPQQAAPGGISAMARGSSAQARPMPMQGAFPGGFSAMARGGQQGIPGRQAPQQPGFTPGAALGSMGGQLLSDERSKEKISRLQGLVDRFQALSDGGAFDRGTANAFRERANPEASRAGREAGEFAADRASFTPERGRREMADMKRDLGIPEENPFGGVGSYSYEYEDPDQPGASPGKQVGPMAQELERIPGVVSRRSDGLRQVDPGRLSLANASAQGETAREVAALRERLAALEDDPDAVLDEAGGRRR